MGFLKKVQETNPSSLTKTPYQMFVSQPVAKEWTLGDDPTNYGQALATINQMYKTDPVKAQEKLTLLNQYRTQPGNMWYDAYATPTNRDVDTLKSYGIDPTELTSDWYNANNGWQAYLRYNGTTNTPSKPTKKSTDQEKLAYALYQYQKSMPDTTSAKSEWAAAQDEIAYWASRKDLNMSDDDIINKVFGSNKYKTLKRMDDSRNNGSPLELNEAIDYNPDSVRGVIWAARNDGGTGNSRQDIANYYSRFGNNWVANDEISAKLNKADLSTYSPHEIGMTGKDMDEVGAYFGKSSFAPGEIETLRNDVDWNDATAVKIFQKGYDAEQTTLKAEEELAEFTKLFQKRLNGRGFTDQNAANKWIDEQLNSGDFNTLKKMDDGMVKGEPINMTRAVPYRKQMFQQAAYDAIANPLKSGAEVLNAYGVSVPEAETANTKVEDENVIGAFDTMAKYLTKDESDYLNTVPGVEYKALSQAMNGVKASIDIEEVGKQYGKVNGEYTKTVLGAVPVVNQYKKYQQAANNMELNIKAFEDREKDRILANESIEPEKFVETDDVFVQLHRGTDGYYTVDDQTVRTLADAAYGELRNSNPNLTWEDCYKDIMESSQKVCDEENAKADAIREARERTGDSGLATPGDIAQYESDKEQLRVLNEWLANNKEGYDTAIKSVEDSKARRDAVGKIAANAAGYEYDPYLADTIIDYAGAMYNYESPEVDGFTLIDESAGKSAEEIGKEITENNASIQDLQFILSALGDNVPEELRRKFDTAIADAERQNRIYNDYLITEDPKFEEYVKAGKEWDSIHNTDDSPVGGDVKNWFGQLTSKEKDIYFALVGKEQDWKSADQFYKDIRDDLQYRLQYKIDTVTNRVAESGFIGRLLSEAGAVLLAPINTFANTAYSVGVALGYDEAEARAAKVSSHISNSQHQANINAIKDTYKDNPALSEIFSGFYEIMYNRGNSLMNALTWGKLMPQFSGDGKVAEFFNNVLSATPIALSAASDALENAIDRNASPEQQAIIFVSTLIAESWTEGIEFGHIEKNSKLLLSKDGFLQFLKAYPSEAISEVIGESLNDVIENEAGNHWAKLIDNPNYESEHEAAVKRYMAEDQNLTPEQAEAMVYQDEIAGVLHTAVISALSPGADVFSMAANTVLKYNQYAREAKEYNENATGKHAKQKSIRDIRLEHEAAEAEAKAKTEEAKLPKPEPVAEEKTETPTQPEAEPEQYPVNGPDEPKRRSFGKAMDAYDSNIILLEEAIDSNSTTQAAAIASALDTGNAYMAQAAGAKLNLGMVQAMLIAGKQANINLNTLQMGIQLAALGNGECANVLANGMMNGMSVIQMAEQIAAAVPVDLQNDSVLKGVQAGVHNARVNEEFKRLMATGMAEDAVKAQEKIDAAREATRVAEEEYEQKNNELDAARNGVSEAATAIAEDPINDGNMLTGALAKMTAASAVVDEYSMKLDKARKDQQKIEEDNKKTIEATTAYMRQQAEKAVAEQEAVEAQEKAQAEEQARVAAEEQAKAEVAQREADNATRLDADAFIEEKFPNTTEEQKEQIRQQFKETQKKMGLTADAILARGNFEKQLAKKFGLNVRHVDSVEENGEKFSLFNARIDQRTGELLVNNKATQNDIFYAVLIHEITHLAEQNEGAYAELADAVLQMQYGDGVTFQGILDQMEKGDVSSRLAQDILGKKGLYDERLNRDHTNKEMLQEIVADEVGKIISGDEKALNNLVAEKPSLARRLLDGIRNFLNKMRGMQGEVVTQAQKVADMLSAALENTQQNDETVKYALGEGEENAIYVKDGKTKTGETVDFINKILDREKEYETRDHKGLTRKQWLGLAKDGQVYGRVKLGEPFELKAGTPEYDKSFIKDTDYDIEDGKTKYAYPVLDVEDFRSNPKPILRNGNYGQYKYSLPSDADYMSAVENGDMEKAQEIVDQDAKDAGFTDEAYHGTDDFGFTQFDMPKSQNAIFVAYSRLLAETYAQDSNGFEYVPIRDISSAGANGRTMSDNELAEFIKNHGIFGSPKEEIKSVKYYTQSELQNRVDEYNNVEFRDSDIEDALNDPNGGIDIEYTDGTHDIHDEDYARQIVIQETGYGGLYRLYTRPGNQLVIDADGKEWNELPWSLVTDEQMYDENGKEEYETDTRGVAEWAREHGYDSIRVNNIWDAGGQGGFGRGDIGIFFNPSDVKSADTVTYDDNGNIIPPSERFNEQKQDIRWSLTSPETTQQMIEQWLAKAANGEPSNAETSKKPQRQYNTQTMQSYDYVNQLVKDVIRDNADYKQIKNSGQLDKAVAWVVSNRTEGSDPTGIWGSIAKMREKSFNADTLVGQARLAAVTALASATDDIGAQVAIHELVGESGTRMAQAFQFRRIFRLMGPQARMQVLQTEVNRINKELEKKGKLNDKTRVKLDQFILEAAAAAKTEEEFKRVQEATRKAINEQIPVSWKEKLMAWRMFSMLGAPTTHLRNIFSNINFIPMVASKNKVGAIGELIAQASGKIDRSQRTKTLRPFTSRENRKWASDYANKVDELIKGEGKYTEGTKRQRERQIFGTKDNIISKTLGKAIEWGRTKVGNALEAEDWFFSKGHFRRAMTGLMEARGLTPADMTGDVLEEATQYAALEAQKATYRDASAIADFLGSIDKQYKGDNGTVAGSLKFLQFLVNARFPFKRTPINIAKRGLEYSPIGFTVGLYDLKKMKTYIDYSERIAAGEDVEMPKNAMSPTQVIDKLASGLTGTGVMALGFLLGKLGLARCAFDPDDPEDQIAKLKGDQEYSIRPGAIGNYIITKAGQVLDKDFKCELFNEDVSMTLDWAAPVSLELFTGVSLGNALEGVDDEDGSFMKKALKSLTEITEPMLAMSCLQSVNNMFYRDAYSDTSPIAQFLIGTFTDYIPSYIPTPVAKLANTLDPTRRTTYTESGDEFPQVTRMSQKIMNNLRFLGFDTIPYRDAFGNESEHYLPPVIEQFVSPAYFNDIKNGDLVLDELERLIKDTKNNGDVKRKNLVPSNPDKTIKVNGESYKLNGKEYDQIKEDGGKIAAGLLRELMTNEAYLVSSDTTRAKMVSSVYSYAEKVAQYNFNNGVSLGDYEDAYKSGNPIKTIIDNTISSNRTAYTKTYSNALARAVEAGDQEEAQMCIDTLHDAGISDSSIRTYVSNYFRPLYKEAYATGNDDLCDDIEYKLEDLDIGYSNKDHFKKWRKAVDDGEKDEDEEQKEEDERWLQY